MDTGRAGAIIAPGVHGWNLAPLTLTGRFAARARGQDAQGWPRKALLHFPLFSPSGLLAKPLHGHFLCPGVDAKVRVGCRKRPWGDGSAVR